MKLLYASPLFGGLLLTSNIVCATPVPHYQLDQMAENFIYAKTKKTVIANHQYTTSSMLGKRASGTSTLRYVEMDNGTWVLMSTNDNVAPILAYSLEPKTSLQKSKSKNSGRLPPALRDLVKQYDEEIKSTASAAMTQSKARKSRLWSALNKPNDEFVTYNEMDPLFPEDKKGGDYVTRKAAMPVGTVSYDDFWCMT